MFVSVVTLFILVIQLQEFSRIVLCHQLWLMTEADEIQKDKNSARDARTPQPREIFLTP